jgi:N-acetylglucosamine kinase-like BadF-type ATPase
MMELVLGVDGGNTKTIALIARRDGTILGAGRSGCGDIYGVGGEDGAIASIAEAVRQALKEASAQPADLTAGVFSLAGADWPEDFDFLHAAIQSHGFGKTIAIVNDALGALRAGSPDGTGVCIVCGTGAGTAARAPDGRTWHSSFWQRTQGSQELGRKMLNAVYHAELGIEPPTSLTRRALELLGAPSVEAILHRATARRRQHPAPDYGLLARALLEEAAGGDPAAAEIVQQHGIALAEYGLAAARQVGLAGAPFALILAGSVLHSPGSPLAAAIIEHVRSAMPGVTPVFSRYEPAVGALLLALERAGAAADGAVRARLDASLPPPSLFAT